MFSPSKAATIKGTAASLAAAAALSASAETVNLTNSSISPPTAPISAEHVAELQRQVREIITLPMLREAVAEERTALSRRALLFRDAPYAALEKLERSLNQADNEEISRHAREYLDARDSAQLRTFGVLALDMSVPVALLALAYLHPSLMRKQIGDIIDNSTALDLQDREFLEGVLGSEKGFVAKSVRSFNALSYMTTRTNRAAVTDAMSRYVMYATGTALAVGGTVIGAALMTGSAAATFAVSAITVPAVLFALKHIRGPRPALMMARFKAWRKLRDEGASASELE